MQIRLLGHLEASVDDRPVALGGSKQRAVLAMLGLEANRLVSSDRLIEGLWGEATRGASVDAARQALALFGGDPLADIADEPFAPAEIRRLEELRLTAAELAIDADLTAGRHHELIGEVEALLAENPLREQFHAQHMLALTAPTARRRRSRPTARRAARSSSRSGSSPAPSCSGCTPRSCAMTRR